MPQRYRITRQHFLSLSPLGGGCTLDYDHNAVTAGDAEPVFLRQARGKPVVCERLRWGIEIGERIVINTKAENTYKHRGTLVHGRCLIPMSGWFDFFRLTDCNEEAVLVQSQVGTAFCGAGLWVSRLHPQWKDYRKAFSMLTCPAGSSTIWLNPRMPLLVPEEQYTTWLSEGLTYEAVCELMPALVEYTRRLRFAMHPVKPLLRHIIAASDFGGPSPWWKPHYLPAMSVLHRRQFVCPAEFAAELAMSVAQAGDLLAEMHQKKLVDLRPNPAVDDLEMWALPVQDEDAARTERWRKERVKSGER